MINVLAMRLVRISAGEFEMGSHESLDELHRAFPHYEARRFDMVDEYPLHRVRITRDFLLGRHPVTVDEFRAFVSDANYRTEAERDGTGGWGYNPRSGQFEGRRPEYTWHNPGFEQRGDHPVVNVSWHDAVAFCQWLSRFENAEYRLPTEAEWEYACRAGTNQRYGHCDDASQLVAVGNLFDADSAALFPQWKAYALAGSDGYAFTSPVGNYQENDFGLCDMHGNVWEWCADWYGADYYARSPLEDPTGPTAGEVRVRRGGSWHTWPLYARAAFRNWNTPESRYLLVGFRVARSDDGCADW